MTLRTGMEHVLVALVVVFLAAFLTSSLAMRSGILSDKPYEGVFFAVSEEYDTFAYRALVPQLSRAVTRAVPQYIQKQVNEELVSPMLKSNFMKELYGKKSFSPYESLDKTYNYFLVNVSLLISFVFLCAYAVTMRKLAAHYFSRSLVIMLVPILALVMLLPTMGSQSTVSDPAMLFFSALLLYFLQFRRLLCFVVFYTLACVNSPLTLLFLPLFLRAFSPYLSRVMLWSIALYMLLIWWGTVAGNTYYVFSIPRNVGGNVLGGELEYFKRRISGLLMLWLLIDHAWDSLPKLIKEALLLIPIAALCYCVFGLRQQYGYFYAIFPALTLAAMYTLSTVFEPQKVRGVLC